MPVRISLTEVLFRSMCDMLAHGLRRSFGVPSLQRGNDRRVFPHRAPATLREKKWRKDGPPHPQLLEQTKQCGHSSALSNSAVELDVELDKGGSVIEGNGLNHGLLQEFHLL